MRKHVLAVCIGVLLVIATAGATLAAPGASPQSGKPKVTSGVETLRLSTTECDQLKAQVPAKANDPRLCEFTHGWAVTTESAISSTSAITLSSCLSTTAHFHDYLTGAYGFWQYDMDTDFRWNGNCSYPTLTNPHCYWEWTISTTFSEEQCYSYHYYSSSGWTSTAAVNRELVTTNIGGVIVRSYNNQRRECYSNSGPSGCNWTAWLG